MNGEIGTMLIYGYSWRTRLTSSSKLSWFITVFYEVFIADVFQVQADT